ncbi:hypothetical protein ACS0TY_030298 [Phlomoides rotata]
MIEALALRFGVSEAVSKGLQILALETNSQVLARALQGETEVDVSTTMIVEDILVGADSLGALNQLSGEIPREIGALSNLEELQLHTNSLSGTLPPSLARCSKLTTLILRNNLFGGDISDLSKLGRLQTIDLGNNSLVGKIPDSLCLCRSLSAVRLAHNQLVGEIPPCIAFLTSLTHLALTNNRLSNVAGALEILRHCDNLEVLFLSRCFHEEMMPDDQLYNVSSSGFQNLQILTLGGGNLKGQIPSWISKLRKLKVLNLSYNRLWGRIPSWLGAMPSLNVLNLTQNLLTGELPPEMGGMPALISDNTSSDLTSLALPFLYDNLQFNRLFNLPRGLKVGNNSLSGSIPEEIGRLRLLNELDLSNNNFDGSLPSSLSGLINLERLDLSGNHLGGEIPQSWTRLHFISSFSIANNDLQGEIPRGGQFETFPLESFEGNPKLCGYILTSQYCRGVDHDDQLEEEDHRQDSWLTEIVTFGCMITRQKGGKLEPLNLEIEATARRNRGRNRREQLRRRQADIEEMAEDNIVDPEVERVLGGNENEEMERGVHERGRHEVPNAQGGGGPNQVGNNQGPYWNAQGYYPPPPYPYPPYYQPPYP